MFYNDISIAKAVAQFNQSITTEGINFKVNPSLRVKKFFPFFKDGPIK